MITYDLHNTPAGKFQVLYPPPARNWETATLQEVAQALRDYATDPLATYHNMIYYALQGSPKGDVRLGDSWYRFYPF